MKISLIGPVTPYRGGIAQFTTMLAKQLIEAEHDVQVISFNKQYPAWLYPGKSDKDYSPTREKVEAEFIIKPLNPLSWEKTVRAIAAFKPDQIIFPWWVTFWGPAFTNVSKNLRRKGFPITFLIHNTIPHEARSFDKWLAKRTLRQADRYIVMTQKEKQRLLDLVPSAKLIDVANLPIYDPFPPTGMTKEEIREKLNLPKNIPILLFFGFVRPYKGLADLLIALEQLITNRQNVYLVIAGEFWHDQKAYKQQISSLSLEQHIQFFDGFIPDNEVALYFEAADLFIAPYTGGTQSGALKTALGFGLPAVITDVISDEFIIRQTEQCKIVRSGDPTALAQGIRDMLGKPRVDEKHREALFRYSWKKLIEIISSYQTSQTE